MRFSPWLLPTGQALWLHTVCSPARRPSSGPLSPAHTIRTFPFLFFPSMLLKPHYCSPWFCSVALKYSQVKCCGILKGFWLCIWIRRFTECDYIWLSSTKLLNCRKNAGKKYQLLGHHWFVKLLLLITKVICVNNTEKKQKKTTESKLPITSSQIVNHC